MYCAEWINTYGANNWQSFATQNYFDKNGVFVSVVFSGPMLAASMFLLLNALRSASSLLVEVKREELKHTARKRKAAAKQAKQE